MKNLFNDISQEEKNRILEMHSGKKNVIFEQNSQQVYKEVADLLYNSMKENFNNIQNTNQLNNNLDTTNQLNDITYLNTLLSNSNKFFIQKSYIIITLLVILLGLIIVLYKIKK